MDDDGITFTVRAWANVERPPARAVIDLTAWLRCRKREARRVRMARKRRRGWA